MTIRLKPGDPARPFELPTLGGEPFRLESTGGRPLILIFTRYVGCMVCQMQTARIREAAPEYKSHGARVAVVYQSSLERMRGYFGDDVPSQDDLWLLSDPKGEVYDLYGVPRSLLGYIAPSTIVCAIKAYRAGYRHGATEGHETQMPGEFLIDRNGVVQLVHYGRHAGDHLAPHELIDALPNEVGHG